MKIITRDKLLKLIALVLALTTFVASMALVSCNNKTNEEGSESESGSAETPSETEEEIVAPDFDYMGEDLTRFIKLGQYKGLELTVPEKEEITDELLWAQINSDLIASKKYNTITDRAVTKDDVVYISYKGLMNGEEFEGGTGEKDMFTVYNGGGFIEGFAEGIIGAMPGQEVAVELNFPEDYYEDLAGKPVTFMVTVKHIYVAAELTDDIAKELTGDKEMTRDSIVAKYRELLEERAEQIFEENKMNATWTKIFDSIEIVELPTDLIDEYYQFDMKYYETYAKYYGVTLETMLQYVGMTEESVYEEAKNNVLTDMMVYSVIKAENIVIDDEEYDKLLAEFLEESGCKKEELESQYSKDDLMEMFIYTKVYEAAVEWQSFTFTSNTETNTEAEQ
jgi:trigger factor